MNFAPRRVFAQMRKELIQVRRDPVGLGLAIVLPLFLMTMLGLAISLSVTNIAVVMQDLDQTPMSLSLADAFRTSLTVRVVPLPIDQEPEKALLAGTARGAIIVPEHFERDVRRGRPVEIQVLVDATDANTANVLRGTLSGIVQQWSAQQQSRQGTQPPPVGSDIRLWYNPGRKDYFFIGPGAFVVGLALLPPLLASLAMTKERERGTILQVYVSGVSAIEFLLGKVLAYCLIAGFDWLLGMAVCYGLFDLRLQGDPTAFLFGSACFIACVISFGSMIGARVADQTSALQAMQFGGFVLTFLLSGFIFPVANIPGPLRILSAITPARYFIEIVRDAFLRGGGWPTVWLDILPLMALGSFFFIMAWKRLRAMQLDL